jgi:putative endonuclease
VPRGHTYFVYILASKTRRLYVGMTNNLEGRVWRHKHKTAPSFTSRYNIGRLVYFEAYQDVFQAIGREKEIKKWRREKKIELIELEKRDWRDLSSAWFIDAAPSASE